MIFEVIELLVRHQPRNARPVQCRKLFEIIASTYDKGVQAGLSPAYQSNLILAIITWITLGNLLMFHFIPSWAKHLEVAFLRGWTRYTVDEFAK